MNSIVVSFFPPKGNDWSPLDAPKEKETPFFII